VNGLDSVGIAAKIVTVFYCISCLVASVIVLLSEPKNFTLVEAHLFSCTLLGSKQSICYLCCRPNSHWLAPNRRHCRKILNV